MGFNDISGKVKDIKVIPLEVDDGISVDLCFEKDGKKKRIIFPSPLPDAKKDIKALYERGLIEDHLYEKTINLLNSYVRK